MRSDEMARVNNLLQRGRWFLSRLRHFESQLDRPRPQFERQAEPITDQQLERLYLCLKAEYQPADI